MDRPSQPFLSRHYLGENAAAITLLPFPPGGAPGEDGLTISHNLLAAGTWAEDEQEYRVSIFDLAVPQRGGDDVAAPPTLGRLATFPHRGAVTAIEAAEVGSGSVYLVAASAEGRLTRLCLQVPTAPGSSPDAVQLRDDLGDGGGALPTWMDAHGPSAVALDLNADQQQVLSAGEDGSIVVASMEAAAAPAPFFASAGAMAFTAARWLSAHTFATTTVQGALHAWDARQRGGRPALAAADPDRSMLLCLAAAVQPHVCATGSAEGEVGVWDLRGAGRVAAAAARCDATPPGIGGAVLDVAFHAPAATMAGAPPDAAPRVLYCTLDGGVGLAGADGSGAARLYQEPSAGVRAIAPAAAGAMEQLLAANDQEGLIYMANYV